MEAVQNFKNIIPVLPSADIYRDIDWHKEKTGFEPVFFDKMYAGLYRDGLTIHLQWHADTPEDPLLGGSVIRIPVNDVKTIFEEFVQRGTVEAKNFMANTSWGTNEFAFFDLNSNGIIIMEDLDV